MAQREADFLVAGDISTARVLEGLRRCAGGRSGTRLRLHRTFYDTFDWRLFEAGLVLEHARHGHAGHLIGRELEGEVLASVGRVETPRFARDLPSSPPFARLADLSGIRALLPQVEIDATVDQFCLTNKDDKVVLRLALERNRVIGEGGTKPFALHARLRVIPIAGYRRAFQDALAALRAELGSLTAAPALILEALHAQDREPVDPSPGLRITLDPEMRTDLALRSCLLCLLRAMEVNEAGTVADLDTEFLHDFRVAIRRTRSALSQVKGVFPRPLVAKYGRELAWLAAKTGPVRDLDVHLLDFDAYPATLGAGYEAELVVLRARVRQEHRRRRAELNRALASLRYRRLITGWRRFLESDPPRHSRLPNATRAIADVARERIRRGYKRAIAEGSQIDERSAPESLHELRKTCKKLRYSIELFGSLFPKERLEPCIDRLKSLQDSLGGIQDCAVQARSFQGLVEKLAVAGEDSSRARDVAGLLIQRMERQSAQARVELEERFRAFSHPKERRRYASLFSPSAR